MNKYIPLIILSSFMLSACKPTHDIDWYKKHDNERKEKVAECSKQDESNQDDNCRNALDAQADILNFGKDDTTRAAPMTSPVKQ